MKFNLLPASQSIGMSSSVEGLVALLEGALKSPVERIVFYEPAPGGPHSCRLFFRAQVPGVTGGMSLPKPLSSCELATMLLNPDELRFMRFDPPKPPTPGHKQGWEVKFADILGERIVIVHATWVE